MNSKETQHLVAPRVAFCLIAGALAGFLFTVEASVLELLIWAFGGGPNTNVSALAWVVLRNTAHAVPNVLAVGLVGGLVAALFQPYVPAVFRRWSMKLLIPLWTSVALIYVYMASNRIPVNHGALYILFDLVCIGVLSVAACHAWTRLLRWLNEGKIRRVLLATLALGVGLWIPVVICVAFSP